MMVIYTGQYEIGKDKTDDKITQKQKEELNKV